MREIKFRGKVLDGKWIYGAYLPAMDDDSCDSIINSDYPSGRIVKTDSVGQYTGLKDKNGKEIYEGDIIAHNDRVIGHIIGGVRGYCYDVIYKQPAPEKDWSLYGVVIQDYDGEVEIIGNRFDNPELLK